MRLAKISLIISALSLNAFYLDADARSKNTARINRINFLLERAKARSMKKQMPETNFQEESGYLPAETSKTKDIVYEEDMVTETVPKEPSYEDLVGQFNQLFDETKDHMEHKEEHVQELMEQKITQEQMEMPSVHHAKATEDIKTPRVISTHKESPVIPAHKPEATHINTHNSAVQTINKTEIVTHSKVQHRVEHVEPKQAPKVPELKHEKVEEVIADDNIIPEDTPKPAPEVIKQERSGIITASATPAQDTEEKKAEPKKEEVKKEEPKEEIAQEVKEEESKEEVQEEAKEEIAEEVKEEEPKKEEGPSAEETAAQKVQDYLGLAQKSLQSLEEDSWNEVRLNMQEALEYFEKEKQAAGSPKEVEKFYQLTLAFMRFAEGGLELDQGDFADFEDAETSYLDSQDLLENLELQLKSGNGTDKAILKIVQTVKKYINEDIEYIEEMLDIS